jgi:phosphate transport system permease protein
MNNTEQVKRSLKKRYMKEKIFRGMGMAAVLCGFAFIAVFLFDIFSKAAPAIQQTYIKVDVSFNAEKLGLPETGVLTEKQLRGANYYGLLKQSMYDLFPEATKSSDKREIRKFVSSSAEYKLRDTLMDNPDYLGTTQTMWLLADDDLDTYMKLGNVGRTTEREAELIGQLEDQDRLSKKLNFAFFNHGDSREPEVAGIRSALMGSFYTLLVTFMLSLPLGVAAAIYLEEFAPKNRWTDLIEMNINNLAAVPSIVFGLLGLAVFLNFFGVPRSAPLAGGLVLTLMTLPTIIITSRAAIKAVPPSIAEAALGLGASKMQTVFHYVVPLAMPGILTGAIIGMAQALGESAPLLMIGMIAFIVDTPQGITDAATVLPVQIYLWSDSPERAFVAKTSLAIIVLLVFLVVMNAIAIYLRKKFERQW